MEDVLERYKTDSFVKMERQTSQQTKIGSNAVNIYMLCEMSKDVFLFEHDIHSLIIVSTEVFFFFFHFGEDRNITRKAL